jgi:hypothetical protein
MTAITEITLTQMQIMNEVNTNMPTFIIGVPVEGDTESARNRMNIANAESKRLVELGFLEDLTMHNQAVLDQLELSSGRKHRIFHLTEVGRAFFSASASQLIN